MRKFFIALVLIHTSSHSMADWVMEISFYTPTAQEIAAEKQKRCDELLSHAQYLIGNNKNLSDPIAGEALQSTPLHRTAVDDFYLPVTQLFLNNGADPNKTDYHGYTPLHRAAENICLETITCLLEKKANPHLLTCSNRTPLYLICDPQNDTDDESKAHKRVLAATVLLKAGANPNIKSLGETPLHALIGSPFKRYTFQDHLMNAKEYEIFMNNRKELIKLILDHGGDLSITNSRDLTPIQKADYHHPASSHENTNDCKKLADFAVTYLNDSRKKTIVDMMTP